ncbi:ABC-F family ATP-binding cassette domain-containing protein [candidate division WOR-3 bacterium]|uniref:ABC-F family ATP-binding cassette domain-containing protein n=1 Tax=candidate division WOR-3 bacterium TaxID=2052148 RepID=A0A938BQS4_UNCW3|nr:ABC-F family ATP-binding cassette domain-containing protein [candidate division WOR-3 bacterium]
MLINATDIGKSLGAETVLQHVSFTISPGEKIGLVGPNGSGKTTLLKLILRQIEPDQGDIAIAGEPEIGYVRQDVLDDEDLTVEQALFGEMEELEARLAQLRKEIAASPDDEGELAKDEVIEDELNTRFGNGYRSRCEKTLAQFGFNLDRYKAKVNVLSPGERARLELARVLVREPNLLILDEPTNFLDIGQREWLERFLEEFAGTVLVVSHDRVFLDRVVNRVFDLRRSRLTVYEGDYDDYELAREQERAKLEHEHEVQQKEIHKLERAAEERKVWSARREKTKTAAHDSGFEGHRAAKMAKRAKHAEKRIEQMIEAHEAKKPIVEKRPRPVLVTEELPDKRAVLAKDLTKSFSGRTVIEGASFEMRTGERVAVIGPNGSGKTVLLRMLVSELEPDKGKAQFGAGTRVGYFPQDITSLDLKRTALEEVMESGANQETARTVLGTLLLRKAFAEKKLSELSAGERSKVLLARILAGGANLLILDEPTNHLDIDALLALENLLANAPVGVLFATHDRALLSRLADRVLELRDARLIDHRERYEALVRKS